MTTITPTVIPEVLLHEPRVFGDRRGYFLESWNQRELRAAGFEHDFVQENHSYSSQGTLRGLHYQIRKPQGKLVRAVTGRIFDVAVDLRRSSPTFGRWVGEWLTEENHRMLWIPKGFAHGFYVASESAHCLYKCTGFYAPEHERTIAWNDAALAIDWPLVDGQPPLLSEKDRDGKAFAAAEVYE